MERWDMYFERWGLLPWLEPDEYWKDKWDYIGTEVAEDNHMYDIVILGREMAYTYL